MCPRRCQVVAHKFTCCQHPLQPLGRSLPPFRSRLAVPQPCRSFVANPLLQIQTRSCPATAGRARTSKYVTRHKSCRTWQSPTATTALREQQPHEQGQHITQIIAILSYSRQCQQLFQRSTHFYMKATPTTTAAAHTAFPATPHRHCPPPALHPHRRH